eukprot:TRINITY_DN1362_c0_g1_i1.p1 TRINITY_DN1362_c0_g1~~TRINITY_DN1362_c0_g1_i1.p1  ORF type:complete len:386 (-),score=123.78 TRINITY_DN1362_c0_g1_i1:10-1167(-)
MTEEEVISMESSNDTMPAVATEYVGKEEGTLKITLTDPEQVDDGKNKFIAYTVNTSSSMPTYNAGTYVLSRRFREFISLRELLDIKYPMIIVPPAPEKALLGRFNVEFVEARRIELQMFLDRLASHAVLRSCPEVHSFLTGINPEALSPRSKGVFAPVTGVFSKLAEKFQGTVEISSWVGEQNAALEDLEKLSKSISTAAQKLVTRTRDLAVAYSELSSHTLVLATSPATEDMSEVATQSADAADKVHTILVDTSKTALVNFDLVLKDIVKVTAVAKVVLERRVSSEIEFRNLQSKVTKKRESFEKSRAKPGKEEKAAKEEQELKELEDKEEEALNSLNDLDAQCKLEFENFHKATRADLENAYKKLCSDLSGHFQKIGHTFTAL